MASAKSVFERPTVTSETSPKLSKKASKWDKPKSVPPPAVNRDTADNTDQQTVDSELPPPAYTKNMLAKFQAIQQSDAQPIKDSDINSSKPRKLWEDDELPRDDVSPSSQDVISASEAAAAAAADDDDDDDDDVTGGVADRDGETAARAVASEGRESHGECEAEVEVNVEGTAESEADHSEAQGSERESDGKQEECLISLDDDDGGAEMSASPQDAISAVNDAAERHVESYCESAASEGKQQEGESQEQDCLISWDDDGSNDLAALSDTTERHVVDNGESADVEADDTSDDYASNAAAGDSKSKERESCLMSLDDNSGDVAAVHSTAEHHGENHESAAEDVPSNDYPSQDLADVDADAADVGADDDASLQAGNTDQM